LPAAGKPEKFLYFVFIITLPLVKINRNDVSDPARKKFTGIKNAAG
jgi:hypothetical protein